MSVLDGERRERRRILIDGKACWCEPQGDRLVLGDGTTVFERDSIYLPPCEPTKILCVHLNFRSRAIEFGRSLDGETPTYFQKPVTTLNTHRGEVACPADCRWVNFEGEIAAIVGARMKNVSPEHVWDYLAGFSPANDIGAHDFRDTDAGSMLRVKGMDGFCPIGPGIVSGVDIRTSTLRTYLNGELVQEGPVSDMVWGIDYLLADLSRHITLVPGDIVLTGTPWYSRPMEHGDVVEVDVEGLGRLTNTVVSVPAPHHVLGHQAVTTKLVRAVSLGKDYQRMKKEGYGVSAEDYFHARGEFLRRNREEGSERD
tara:strand:+ start:173 stop:1111 length:939 start_codon:yes stop_codon:yes gene_type:complete